MADFVVKPHIGCVQLTAVIAPALGMCTLPVFPVSWHENTEKAMLVYIRHLLKEWQCHNSSLIRHQFSVSTTQTIHIFTTVNSCCFTTTAGSSSSTVTYITLVSGTQSPCCSRLKQSSPLPQAESYHSLTCSIISQLSYSMVTDESIIRYFTASETSFRKEHLLIHRLHSFVKKKYRNTHFPDVYSLDFSSVEYFLGT